jgi:hypothetical protein
MAEARERSRSSRLALGIVYAIGVFLVAAVLGFAGLPALGWAIGSPLDTELVTLKSVPALFAGSVASAFAAEWIFRLTVPSRLAAWLVNGVVVYAAGVALGVVL